MHLMTSQDTSILTNPNCTEETFCLSLSCSLKRGGFQDPPEKASGVAFRKVSLGIFARTGIIGTTVLSKNASLMIVMKWQSKGFLHKADRVMKMRTLNTNVHQFLIVY